MTTQKYSELFEQGAVTIEQQPILRKGFTGSAKYCCTWTAVPGYGSDNTRIEYIIDAIRELYPDWPIPEADLIYPIAQSRSSLIFEWNDQPERKKAEVVAVLRKAAELAGDAQYWARDPLLGEPS